jgi:hypothetical protein
MRPAPGRRHRARSRQADRAVSGLGERGLYDIQLREATQLLELSAFRSVVGIFEQAFPFDG